MTCAEHSLVIWADGVPLYTNKDSGCKGEIRRFTVVTDLPGTLSYRWSVDNHHVVLGNGPVFDWSYPDGKVHKLQCTVRSSTLNCEKGQSATLKGKICSECPVGCIAQTAKIPADELKYLTDETGKTYPIQPISTVCQNGSNTVAAKAIKKAIYDGLKCSKGNMNVTVYNNQPGKFCITVTITNCPIRFKSIKVGKTEHQFDHSQC